jgi:hypothetical protein
LDEDEWAEAEAAAAAAELLLSRWDVDSRLTRCFK